MIEHLVTQWQLYGEPIWLVVISAITGIVLPFLLLWIVRRHEHRWWKEFHERHGILLTDVKLYDVELTAEQIKYLYDMGPPHRTIIGRHR